MRYLAGALLCAVLARPALPCGLPELLTGPDPRIKVGVYAGNKVSAHTMTLLDHGTHGEYVSYLEPFNVSAFVVADRCENQKCLDIYVDKDADGLLDEHYRIPYSSSILGQLKVRFKTWPIEWDVKNAFENGQNEALAVLERDLRKYLAPIDMSLPQQQYEQYLGRLCGSPIAENTR